MGPKGLILMLLSGFVAKFAALVADIIREHKFVGTFKTDIWDIFNDKLDWNASGWEDLKKLNRTILPIAEKFELFDTSNEKAKAELVKYLHNFEIIQVGLGAVQEKTLSHQSKLKALQDDVGKINKSIQDLLKSGVSVKPLAPNDFLGGTLLQGEQVTTLVGWYGTGWKLQYKATRDGWAASTFHQLCDGKGSTVTVIKANDCLFGGYLSIPWQTTSAFGTDISASLFTLTNKHGIAPTQFRHGGNGNGANAAYLHVSYGPTFGGGHDIYIADNAASSNSSYSNFPNAYQDTTGLGQTLFAGAYNFTPTEVEVYIKQQ